MPSLALKPSPLSERMGMQPAQLELIRRMCIREDAPDDVLELYLQRCKAIGVDPFEKMIYVIPRSQNVKNDRTGEWRKEIRWTFQSSIDLFRSIAEDSGDYAGQLGPFWTGDGTTWVDVWTAETPPLACKVGVLRNSFKEPLWVTGTYAYYVPRDRAGNPEPTAFWKGEKGAHQLAKCTEELALRKAFPRKLHGLYGAEEMEQADRVPAARPQALPAEEVQDANFTALPPTEETPPPANPEADREKARIAVMALCSKNDVSDDERHELTVYLYQRPSTKDLSTPELKRLYFAINRWLKAREKWTGEGKSWDAEGMSSALAYEIDPSLKSYDERHA